ncbi:hypothetical protein CCA_00504 [Chlamydia caviae GPIC]|uniref:Uncharacterized protein n=1 Tax=Chlamydia caviae (strain ATCC VR-813 / DSM 19441 / 03DC25 / GPIC) TaxID=227941 RepID=Q823C1_CHLCV|nr:hypothetical protein CCA_00504 [Chlamydia caviae GPIC]
MKSIDVSDSGFACACFDSTSSIYLCYSNGF